MRVTSSSSTSPSCSRPSYSKAVWCTLLFAVCAIWVGGDWPISPFCPVRSITGFPCPGCGGTRAAKLLCTGDLLGAILLNPLAVVFCAVCPILLIAYWIDCMRGTSLVNNIIGKPWSKRSTAIAVVLLIVNWIWVLFRQGLPK